MKDDSKNNSAGEEKRRHPRLEVSKKMRYRELVPSEEEGLIQDISEGGLCLVLKKRFDPGTILEIKYEVPANAPKPEDSIVKVIWQKRTDKGYLTGVRFIP
ncbi:MAG: PilZ domain-containing protein [Candidatus Aminicenantes bacterium]|jgi:hypothetical protein